MRRSHVRPAAVALATALLLAAVHEPRAADGAAEPLPPPSAPSPAKPYGWRTLGRDSRYLLTRPSHLDRRGWTRVGITLAVAGGLYAYREDLRDWVQDHRTAGRDRLLNDVRGVMGGPGLAAGLALASWGASYATHDDREKETAQLLLTSLAYSSLAAAAGQFVLASERPRDGNAIHFFRSGGHGVSGDAAIAASVVAPLRRQYLAVRPEDGRGLRVWKRAGTGMLYAGAVLTALQRVNVDAHWAPDAFLGTVAGLTVGETLCDAHVGGRGGTAALSVLPIPGGGVAAHLRIETGRGPRR